MTRILVIDDEHDLLDNVSTILELAGYEVFRADNGIDGLRLIHDHLPALIVCDIMMPEISGYDVLEELQTNSTTVSIPIIFLTAKSEMHDIRRGMQAGADDYLVKPFTEQDLLTAIQRRLEKRRSREMQQRVSFSRDLVQTQEQQAQRLARVLDQGFRQKLINIKFWFDTQMLLMPAANAPFMGVMQESLNELLTQITMVSYELYPVMLSHLGLTVMLQWYFNTIQQRLATRVTFETYNMDVRLGDESELIFYRIAQRVMENVITATHDIHVVLWRDENIVRFSMSHLPEFDQNRQWHLLQLLEEYGHTIHATVGLQAEEQDCTTVYVTLHNAVFQPPGVMPQPALPPPVPGHDLTLLAASPDTAFLEHITNALASTLHVTTHQTADPNTLLPQLAIHAPNVLVLDVLVPPGDLALLSSKSAVIVVSPYPDEDFARQTLRQGAMGFVSKSTAPMELLSAVQTVMQGVRYVSAGLIIDGGYAQSAKPLNLDALLTRREREIMELILQDLTHADIAAKLVISPRTVEKHRANVMQKLALSTHTELILFALRHGLMSSA